MDKTESPATGHSRAREPSRMRALAQASGVTLNALALASGICPSTLTSWAEKRPRVVQALIVSYLAGVIQPTPADRVALAAQADRRRRRTPDETRTRAKAARDRRLRAMTPAQRQVERDRTRASRNRAADRAHAEALAEQRAWGVVPTPQSNRWSHERARRCRLQGGDVTAAQIRALLASQGERCAYCGLALRSPWLVRRDAEQPPHLGNLLGLCPYHGARKGGIPDAAYRFDNGIPTVTPWDPEIAPERDSDEL